MVAALILGELAAFAGSGERNAALFIFIAVAVMAAAVKKEYVKVSVVFIIMLIVGCCLCHNRKMIYERYDRVQYGYETLSPATIEGEVRQIQLKNYIYEVMMSCDDGNILLYMDNAKSVRYGEKITVLGEIIPMSIADNPGNFDEREYMHSQGVILKVDVADYTVRGDHNDYNQIEELLYNLKNKFLTILGQICTEKEKGLVSAIVLGEKNGIDDGVKELYSMNNITHILSISGLHISAAGMGIYRLLRKRLRYGSSAAVSGSVMILFLMITGSPVSAVRAVIMFTLRIAADVLGRRYDMISSVSFAALLLLTDNPYYLTNSSFILSFGAMAAVSVTAPVIQKFLCAKNKIVNAVIFNMSITFTMLPVNSMLFYRISTYAPVLNLIVVPLMGIVLVTSAAGITVSFFAPQAGEFVIGGAVYILRFYTELCNIFLKLPHASVVTGNMGIIRNVLYYICLVCMLVYMRLNRRKEIKTSFMRRMCVPCVLVSVMIFLVYGNKSEGFLMCFLDVGQGESIYIHSDSGYDYLIDGGSTDEKRVGEYKIESFLEYYDVDSLEYVFISHFDTDHVSGISEILERGRIEVKNIVISNAVQNNDNENYIKIMNLANKNHINIINFTRGDILEDGELELMCLSPDKESDYGDINDNSMVLHMSYKSLSAFFTGDISSKVEKEIIRYVQNNMVDSGKSLSVYKAAHHGSGGSSSEEFLKMIEPDIAIISCGEDNSYGHPHAETLNRLEATGSEILRTDELGAIILTISSLGEVETEGYRRSVGQGSK